MSAHAPLTPLSGDIGTPPPAETLPPPATAPPAQDRNDLELRRERLARDLAQLQWDLGGLTYEMAIRDHFRLDVLIRQAGMLQDVDAELAETERLIALDEAQHLVDGGSEADVGAELAHERRREHRPDALGERVVGPAPATAIAARGQEEQRAEVGIVLGGQRAQRLVEPVARLVHDHDGHDRGHELLVGVHDGARLAAALRAPRSHRVPRPGRAGGHRA